LPSECHKTSLEKKMYGILCELGFEPRIDFYEQYPKGRYLLDFAFIQSRRPFHGLDIEVDGYPFHSTPQQRRKDGYRTYKLIKNGWCVERFGEQFGKEDVITVLNKHNITIPTTG
jgi:very-short-patch-repair endonuclease